jgi:hypothetical protein
MKKHVLITILIVLSFNSLLAQKQWWLDEPVRLLQTNLPMHLVPEYSPEKLVEEVVESGANTWLFNVGGIYSYYPTSFEFQTVNPYVDSKRDFAGELMTLARKKNIRIIGRFDFSRFPGAIAKQHPEWAFRRADGQTVGFNDLVTACVNGGYYQEHAIQVVEEAMSRYNLDGILINWWGNHLVNSYIGETDGICHCESCRKKWSEVSDEPLPTEPTPEYNRWHNKIKSDLESRIQMMVEKYNKNTALILFHLTGNRETLEGFTTETKTGPLTNEWWLYQSSYYVNKYRNSYPDKGLFNTVVNFIEMNYRFAPHRFMVNQTRIFQSMAHGTFPSFYMIGMPSQYDTSGARSIHLPFEVHRRNEKYFVHQQSVAEVIVIDDMLSENMKGMINILSESHIPHKIILDNKVKNNLEGTRLFIATGAVSDDVLEAVNQGKNLIVIGNIPPKMLESEVVGQIEAKNMNRSYWAVTDTKIFAQTSKRKLIYCASDYTELKPDSAASLLLIPAAMSSPPELAGNGMKISDKPGMVIRKYGKGMIAYIPWNAGAMYSSQAIGSINLLFNELIDYFLENKRQVVTDAHPLVEISLMKNSDQNVMLLHLINNTGQLHGSSDKLLPIQRMNFKVRGEFKKIYWSEGKSITSKIDRGYTSFVVDRLDAYGFVVMK